MNKEGDKIRVSESECLTQQVMLDYIHNKLSPAERNHVEKHLLECDFCSYAMEGLSLMKNDDVLNSLDELISERVSAEPVVRKGKLLSMRFKYGIAAAIALLIMSGGILYFTLSDSNKNERMLSQNLKPNKQADTAHVTNKTLTEEAKVMDSSALKTEEKKMIGKPAIADAARLADHKYVTQKNKYTSKQKPERKGTAAASETYSDALSNPDNPFEKDRTSKSKFDSSKAVQLGAVEVIGYKVPLIDKGNTTTESTIEQQEIIEAPVRTARSRASGGASKAKSSKQVPPAASAPQASYSAPRTIVKNDSSFSFAMKAYNQKQYSKAVQLFDNYLKKYPNDEKAIFYDGVSNLSIDSAATALTQLEQVLVNTQSVFYDDANWYKALALERLGKNKEARKLLRKIKNSNSKHADDAADRLNEP